MHVCLPKWTFVVHFFRKYYQYDNVRDFKDIPGGEGSQHGVANEEKLKMVRVFFFMEGSFFLSFFQNFQFFGPGSRKNKFL